MPCNHDAARNLLGIGWVHTVFLLIPGRSTHGHRQAQVRKERGAEEAGGGGESKVGKKQGRKTMQLGKCSPASRLRVKPVYKHKGESESKNCAAERSKMGWVANPRLIFLPEISAREEDARHWPKPFWKASDPSAIARLSLHSYFASSVATRSPMACPNGTVKKKEKCCARITHETWWKWFTRRVKLCDEQGRLLQLTPSLTDLMGHRLQITIGMSGHALPINITAASIEHDMGKGKVYYITEGRGREGETSPDSECEDRHTGHYDEAGVRRLTM